MEIIIEYLSCEYSRGSLFRVRTVPRQHNQPSLSLAKGFHRDLADEPLLAMSEALGAVIYLA